MKRIIVVTVLAVLTVALCGVTIQTSDGSTHTGNLIREVGGIFYFKTGPGTTQEIPRDKIVKVISDTGTEITQQFLDPNQYQAPEQPQTNGSQSLYPIQGYDYGTFPPRQPLSYQEQVEIAKIQAKPFWLIGGTMATVAGISIVATIIYLGMLASVTGD